MAATKLEIHNWFGGGRIVVGSWNGCEVEGGAEVAHFGKRSAEAWIVGAMVDWVSADVARSAEATAAMGELCVA